MRREIELLDDIAILQKSVLFFKAQSYDYFQQFSYIYSKIK